MQKNTALPLDDSAKLQTKYRLLEVAARHIAQHGYEGASLRRIAADAGVTAAAIYRHYPNGKSDLYEATMELVSSTAAKFVQEGQKAAATAIEQVIAQCDLMWQFFEQYPNVASMIVRENIAGGSQGPSPYIDQNVQIIEGIRGFLDSAINNGEIRAMNVSAFLFWVTSYVTSYHGCQALREVVWTEQDKKDAYGQFLQSVREHIVGKTG